MGKPLRRLRTQVIAGYPVALCGLTLLLFLLWPVVAGDTDVWYHLNAGRYLWQHHRLPADSFFSFLTPPRPWVDYYWLFQAIIYGLYTVSGYYGLIVLRAALHVGMLGGILYLLRRAASGRRVDGWIAFAFSVVSLLLLSRGLLVRPHLVTYFFIVLFLIILEGHPRWRWLLPGLAVTWVNLHGVVYPVMLLILGAYVLEHFAATLFGAWRNKTSQPADIVPLVIAMLAIYCTPHGLALLGVPFQSLSYARHVIMEHQPVDSLFGFNELASVQINALIPSYYTLLNVFCAMVIASAVVAIIDRKLRISHLVLVAGSIFLLTRGSRFINEFTLLNLPLLARHPLAGLWKPQRPAAVWIGVVMVAGLMAMPVRSMVKTLTPRPAYPISRQGLPEGVATFLRHVGVGGSVLNAPSTGGYLEWRLYPAYKIHMDLQTPFLFTDEDLFLAEFASVDHVALARLLSTYRPAFISAPLRATDFPSLISQFDDYRLVFFDDEEALYVNRTLHPEIAQQYELKELDPFRLRGMPSAEVVNDQNRAVMMTQLQRLLAIDPQAGVTNQFMAFIYNDLHQYANALPHAATIIRTFPNSPSGYRLIADALNELGRFEEAIGYYRKVLALTPPRLAGPVYREMGRAYVHLGRFRKAYELLKLGIDVLSPTTTLEDLALLTHAATRAGHPRDAEALAEFARGLRGGDLTEVPEP